MSKAVLGLKDGVIYYENCDKFIACSVSKNIVRIVRIKEHDMGCFVLDVEHNDGRVIEDYLDLGYSLSELGLSRERKDYFKGVRVQDICVKNY